jgi:hypothetical protein
MKTTHIVIPIGVAAPGTPVLSLLKTSIEGILNQTSKDFILTIASDEDVSQECKDLLSTYPINVEWFEPGTFFRRGGIWKKITDCWQKVDSKYVAFLHYDDLWDSEKLRLQVEAMESQDLGCSWSETYVIGAEGQICTGDCAAWGEFSKGTIGSRTTAFAHSCIMRKDKFFSSGIMNHELKWSAIFEDLYTLYAHYSKGRKVPGAKFFWRDHTMNMSSTLCLWTQQDSPWKNEVIRQQTDGGYSDQEVTQDHKDLLMLIRQDYENLSRMYA